MATILITGASRGLGLEFAAQYARAGWRVHATCRDPEAADALNAMAAGAPDTVALHPTVALHRLDVTDRGQILALAAALGGEPIDVLLNNAGVYRDQDRAFGNLDYAGWEETLRVNTLGPMRMAEAFVDRVAASARKLIVCISSQMGSIGDTVGGGGSYAYRSSKTALNSVVKGLAGDLRDRGITVVAVHPGWVATDMGGADAPLSPAESVRAMRAMIERLAPAASGTFLKYDGSEIPW